MSSALLVIDVQRDVVANAVRRDEVRMSDGEPVVQKQFGDSFEGTNLDELLQDLSVDHLMVSDAHTTDDCTWATPPLTAEQVIAYMHFYWKWQRTPRAAGGTSLAAEVVFAS